MQRQAPQAIALALIAYIALLLGCATVGPAGSSAQSGQPPFDQPSFAASAPEAIKRGAALEAAGNEGCVDAYFAACRLAWDGLSHDAHADSNAATKCYNAALAKLIVAASKFGRLDPTRGLVVCDGHQTLALPIVHRGFPWKVSDFQRLHSPPVGHEPLLKRRYACQGVGLPLVVERARNPCDPVEQRFVPEKSFFAATAVLRFGESSSWEHDSGATNAVLQFHNPLDTRQWEDERCPLPLAADFSSSLAKTLAAAPRTYFAGFIEPGGSTTSARLNFLEPYQPGKTPVVLIHGLFSDPQSWADMINDLRFTAGFSDRFQLWVFRYPTGLGFLQSAAVLRRELRAALAMLDPQQADPALQQIVLVGHSMGGLIAKLQVTYSDELIWSQLANRPLEEIVTSESTRAFLAENCFFDPLPQVCRVVFIASPHGGSLRSSGLVGHGASLLVEPSAEQAELHAQLMRDNPGTFNPLLVRRFPTSIDMLVPASPLLEVMRKMQRSAGVKLHNIVGVSHPLSLDGPSDGVVSVHSAKHPDCESVLPVNAPHATVHRTLAASQELLRILGCQLP